MSDYQIFTINPGSTSTKIALFKDSKKIFDKNITHSAEELSKFTDISEQLSYRSERIRNGLKQEGITLEGTDAFVGRGGGCYSMKGGVYELNDLLLEHALHSPTGIQHPANLGIPLAHEFQIKNGGRVFMVNPPTVDEYDEIARITGMKGIFRESHLHALNLKEVGIRHAEKAGYSYDKCNFVICHIGGGISASAHRCGRMVDGNDIIGGEGPMAPTRCGSIPVVPLVKLCYSGKYSEKEMLAKCVKSGGLVDHLGTSDALEVIKLADSGNKYAALIWDSMIYQIIKCIGSMAAVLYGQVDEILLTGGMSHDQYLVQKITDACSSIAPVTAYPGEFEMEAMASGALRVLDGNETVKYYQGKPVWKGLSTEK